MASFGEVDLLYLLYSFGQLRDQCLHGGSVSTYELGFSHPARCECDGFL